MIARVPARSPHTAEYHLFRAFRTQLRWRIFFLLIFSSSSPYLPFHRALCRRGMWNRCAHCSTRCSFFSDAHANFTYMIYTYFLFSRLLFFAPLQFASNALLYVIFFFFFYVTKSCSTMMSEQHFIKCSQTASICHLADDKMLIAHWIWCHLSNLWICKKAKTKLKNIKSLFRANVCVCRWWARVCEYSGLSRGSLMMCDSISFKLI